MSRATLALQWIDEWVCSRREIAKAFEERGGPVEEVAHR